MPKRETIARRALLAIVPIAIAVALPIWQWREQNGWLELAFGAQAWLILVCDIGLDRLPCAGDQALSMVVAAANCAFGALSCVQHRFPCGSVCNRKLPLKISDDEAVSRKLRAHGRKILRTLPNPAAS